MKIVIDAFGGDNAPKEIVKGAVEFLKANKNNELEICLCGDESKIQNELREICINDFNKLFNFSCTSSASISISICWISIRCCIWVTSNISWDWTWS